MRSSLETYKSVAEHCSEFDPKQESDAFTNHEGECDKSCSCLHCNNFTDSSYCSLDLYDDIVSNHNL